MAEEYTVAMETNKADLSQHARTCVCENVYVMKMTHAALTQTHASITCVSPRRRSAASLRCSKMEMSFYINAVLTVFPRRDKVFTALIIAR